MNEAALLAARLGRKAITMADMAGRHHQGDDGPRKEEQDYLRGRQAHYRLPQAGHAVVTYFMTTGEKVQQVSIIPRGQAGGYTMHLPVEDKMHTTRTQLFERIVIMLGGRVAEALVFDDITTGASSDIERSTQLAKSMVTRYGFSDKLGPVSYGGSDGEVFTGHSCSQTPSYSRRWPAVSTSYTTSLSRPTTRPKRF